MNKFYGSIHGNEQKELRKVPSLSYNLGEL